MFKPISPLQIRVVQMLFCGTFGKPVLGFVFSLLPTLDVQLSRNECLTVFLKLSYGVKVIELLCMPLAGSVGYGSFKSKVKW
jgi:hypothetical protein